MTVNQWNQTTQSEFEQLYTMKSTVSDRTQLNLRRALVDASRQISFLFPDNKKKIVESKK
jgi:hypothetical protein